MKNKLILVTGGSRSGKSEFAERLVRSLGKKSAYIATAEICDEEMRLRVENHQARRNDDFWCNFEAPFAAHETIASVGEVDSVLFDCVTIYISNILYAGCEEMANERRHEQVFVAVDLLLQAARESGRHVVFVTNELGSGIVPFDPVTRDFRDLAGLVNQKMAQAADEVYLVVCGLAVELKHLAVKPGEAEVV